MTKGTGSYSLSPITAMGKNRKLKTIRDLFEFVLPPLDAQSMILEIGPGHGGFAYECQRRGLDYLGIEPSKALRSQLEASGIAVVDHVVPPIPLQDSRYDLVHSFDVVEHFCTYHEVLDFFSESFRVLKPGGHISVIAPNYRTIKHLFFQYEYQHSYVTTTERICNILNDCGFEIVKRRCFFQWLSPSLNKLDRLLAFFVIPIATNQIVESVIRLITSEDFLFKIHKNMFDHFAVLARKPSN